jgi:glycosidase
MTKHTDTWYSLPSKPHNHKEQCMPESFFPISHEASQRYSVSGPIFRTPEIQTLYTEAQQLTYRMGNTDAAETHKASRALTPGYLLLVHLLHLAKQEVVGALDLQHAGKLSGALLDAAEPLNRPVGSLSRSYGACYPMNTLEKALADEAAAAEIGILSVDSINPALTKGPAEPLYTFSQIRTGGALQEQADIVTAVFTAFPMDDPENPNLFSYLDAPARFSPDDLEAQLGYIRKSWSRFLSPIFQRLAVRALDVVKEEVRPIFPPGGRDPDRAPDYLSTAEEYEAFSLDSDWMPNVVMLAKSTLVWLDQLSKLYRRQITRLDEIPDEELDLIADRGFNTLWLIGLWERSSASKKIKQSMGNPEAEASAYSLRDYEIASMLGGWPALESLRHRCRQRGIRLASDMVPNHTGIDSTWVLEKPDLFMQADQPPFPAYTFNSQNLSPLFDIGIYLEDHYYDRSDAAVCFKWVDHRNGRTRYIYHGNDGTSMPWNDTAQLDYRNPDTRETVIRTIIHVAKNFPVIRFDAAMTLAKKHIQRLWYPAPGTGGDIPSRAAYGMEQADFDRAIPVEFWREVVDRIAVEAPDTLLLAEAFWMMEGYFVRTLGMHRVYNSAFMNMLKMEDNRTYRDTIKNTLAFEPEILKRFVNFMNNPDEDTAVEQFGSGDKYFGVCTLLVTMPGLPMIGHGQVEGYREKYGMEYSRAYWDEKPDQMLIHAHYERIFPLIKRRHLFSGSENFALFDFQGHAGVHESVFAYTNGVGRERTLVLYNNAYPSAGGWIRTSAPMVRRTDNESRDLVTVTLGEALLLSRDNSCFCIFHGFHDRLTYIRRSSELYERGMYAALSGYETQVFLNFREVRDSDGLYARLCEHLDGRGTEDLELTLKRLRLHAVHTAAESWFSADTCDMVSSALKGDDRVREILTARLIESTEAVAKAWKKTSFPPESILRGRGYSPDPKVLKAAVDNLIVAGRQAAAKSDALARFTASAVSIMPEIPVIIAARLFCLPLLAGHPPAVPSPCASELLLQEMMHDRLYESGIHMNDSYRVSTAVDLIHSESGWFTAMTERGMQSNEKLEQLLVSPVFRTFCGINWHNQVEWYNKEAAQEAFSWLLLSAVLDAPQMKPELRSALHETVLDWYRCEAPAAYRTDSLLTAYRERENRYTVLE